MSLFVPTAKTRAQSWCFAATQTPRGSRESYKTISGEVEEFGNKKSQNCGVCWHVGG